MFRSGIQIPAGTASICRYEAGTAGISTGTKHRGQLYRIAGRYGMELTTLIVNWIDVLQLSFILNVEKVPSWKACLWDYFLINFYTSDVSYINWANHFLSRFGVSTKSTPWCRENTERMEDHFWLGPKFVTTANLQCLDVGALCSSDIWDSKSADA